MPDGTEKFLDSEENATLLIGPLVLVSEGFTLKGAAYDNIRVEQILVEEVDEGGAVIRSWRNASIGGKSASGKQEWSIKIDKTERGECTLRVTAHDRPQNIGAYTVKTVSLLVDLDPPFIKSIEIKRHGATYGADLLPKSRLESLDVNDFTYVDYFQNEKFAIRAEILHEFSLSNVTLNFIDSATGKKLFDTPRQRDSGSSVYTPVWNFTASDFTDANPAYTTGRHYFSVELTATALAGHTGHQNNGDLTNLSFSLCWWPEADKPRVQKTGATAVVGSIIIEKGGVLPISIFDDDNVRNVYAGLISETNWNNYMNGSADSAKLAALESNRSNFPVLNTALYTASSVPNRNIAVGVDASENQGNYRLVVLAQDSNEAGSSVWSSAVYAVQVIEPGSPIITVTAPGENTAPALTVSGQNRTFTLTGTIMNVDAVKFIRIAWIPNTLTGNPQQLGENALKAQTTPGTSNGVRVWVPTLVEGAPTTVGNTTLRTYTFSQVININEFTENDSKFFMLATQSADTALGAGAWAFKTFRLLAYKTPPTITVISPPQNFAEYGTNVNIAFDIEATSPSGLAITTMTFARMAGETATGNFAIQSNANGRVTATDRHSTVNQEGYGYLITATDQLGNREEREFYVIIDAPPKVSGVTAPRSGTSANPLVFSSREDIIVQVKFERPVTVSGAPTVTLSGITNNGSNVTRTASFSAGSGTDTLSFTYRPTLNDYTAGNLNATILNRNGGTINADFGNNNWTTFTFASPPAGYGTVTNDLATRYLRVDARPPTITKVEFINDPGLEFTPWHRAGNELKIEVTVNKAVQVMGSPAFILPFTSGNKNAVFQTSKTNDTVLEFSYTVQDGDLNTSAVRCAPASCIPSVNLIMITDTIGSEGNILVLPASLTAANHTGNATVDAVPPAALTVTGTAPPFQIQTAQIETDRRSVEFTTNGATWTTITTPYTITAAMLTSLGSGTYPIAARQTDVAGNVGEPGTPVSYVVGATAGLTGITCINPNGAYSFYSADKKTLTFQLNFSGKVYTSGAAVTMTITDGANGLDGLGGNQTVTFNTVTKANAGFTLTGTYTIPADVILDPVTVTAITNLGNVRSDSNDQPVTTTNEATVRSTFNTQRGTFNSNGNYLKVLSRRPVINEMLDSTTLTGQVLTPAASKSKLTLKFNQTVWPEKGTITVKPYDNWYIPPVLTNDDFNRVLNALKGTTNETRDTNRLKAAYIRTTHGLQKTGNNYNGTPDVSTKFVLDFNTGITGTGTVVAALRTAFNNAKYQWQEVEVRLGGEQVRGNGNTELTAANGDTTIEVYLDQLLDGRQWKVEISDGAFRDEAGNTFAGWATTTANWFWSDKVAMPVVRVNRISNNRYNIAPIASTTDVDNATRRVFDFSGNNATITYGTNIDTTTTLGTTSENISRLNVQYRIDCETPGAVITQGSGASKTATITDAMTQTATYPARSDPLGAQNSQNADATAAELTAITAGTAYTMGNLLVIGDTDLYTARKDYIKALATRTNPSLTASDPGYEGAFKTVIVYRNVSFKDNANTGRYVKFEGATIEAGSTTVDGFPLTNNDMSGKTSKYAYRRSNTAIAANNYDWIWITWEVVCNFWHVGLSSNSGTPNSALQGNSWNAQGGSPADWRIHTGRRYGNYGLRVGGADNTDNYF
jgi:hypothetical protein